jgi:hypothetical protein
VFDNLETAQITDVSAGSPARRVITRIAVKRPEKQWFFRSHPEFHFQCLTYEDREENETYYVYPALGELLGDFARPVLLHLCMTRQGTLFLFPVKLSTDGSGNQWNATARDGAQRARTYWLSIRANRQSQGYDVYLAEGQIPEPEWPELTVPEILKLAFGDRVILTGNHPVIHKLRGL